MVDQSFVEGLCKEVATQSKATPLSVRFPPVFELVTLAAARWPSESGIVEVMRKAGLSPGDYDLSGTARQVWGDAFMRADNRCELQKLLDAIAREWSNGWCPPTASHRHPKHDPT